jgi:hypothetical protein
VCRTSERAFPASRQAPAQARRFVAEQLAEVLAPHDALTGTVAVAELVASELVSNAVKAGTGALTVRLAVHHRWFQLGVGDDAGGAPRLAEPGPHDPGGRGLQIVQRLTTQWGSYPASAGKFVWCRLEVPGQATVHLDCRVRDRHPSAVPPDLPDRPDLPAQSSAAGGSASGGTAAGGSGAGGSGAGGLAAGGFAGGGTAAARSG